MTERGEQGRRLSGRRMSSHSTSRPWCRVSKGNRSAAPGGAMVASLRIRLEARPAAHRCFRAYGIAVGQDLFGAWMVEMNYGRIGTAGRTEVRSFCTPEDAQAQVDACLRKRATAPRRIGVAYRVQRIVRSEEWRQPGLDNRLDAWFSTVRDQALTH